MFRHLKPARHHWFRNSFLSIAGLGLTAYAYDNTLGDGVSNRVIRSLSTLLLISFDYKLHFDADHDVAALHERNSQRLYDLITRNGGMYIKVGQMIAIQGFMFPKQYQDKFKLMFDKAPQQSWEESDKTLKHELGEHYRSDVFKSIDASPIASASIAQVHRGVLKNGQKVAVKIQKTAVTKQVDADLLTYRVAMWIYQQIFDMPLMPTARYVCNKSREELDFNHELQNASRMASLVDSDPEFKGKVYIPKYYPEISTKKVLIGEWIDGDSIGEYMGLRNKGYNISQLVNSIIKVYSRQIFSWGFVHCDLHPGNLIVRMVPTRPGSHVKRQQLVILDHGLYEAFTDKFKKEYSEFWKYTMEKNEPKVIETLKCWGINPDDMMMTAAGMKDPHSPEFKKRIRHIHDLPYYERQKMLRDSMRQFFNNSDLFPMCLVFVMRSMRIVQGLNRNFGSPCNRIGILLAEADRTVDLYAYTPAETWSEYGVVLQRKLTYYMVRIVSFIAFELNRIAKFIGNEVLGARLFRVNDLEERYQKAAETAEVSMGFE